jgi:nicotinamide riboside kinase
MRAKIARVEPARFKMAFIGTHGVGKTTLCYGLASRLKRRDIALEVVHEIARRCPLPVNEETSLASQSWILHTQIAEEAVAAARFPVVLCDRSVLDNYVYLLVALGVQPELEALVDHWTATYDLLVQVPAIEDPAVDGFRSHDPAFQRLIEERLDLELARRGFTALRLDPSDRGGWIDSVESAAWERLEPAQMSLL